MKELGKIFTLLLMTVFAGNICFANGAATLEKLPRSSYSKLCYQGKCALYDDFDKEIVTDLQYEDIVYIEDTPYLKVKVKGKWALYYLYTDSELTLPLYDDIISLHANGSKYLAVKQNSKWAIFHAPSVKLATGFIYDDFEVKEKDFDGCLFQVKSYGKVGFVFLDTFVLERCNFEYVPAIYDDAVKLSKNYFKVKEQDKWAVFNAKLEKTVSLFEYDDIKYSNNSFTGLKDGIWNSIQLAK